MGEKKNRIFSSMWEALELQVWSQNNKGANEDRSPMWKASKYNVEIVSPPKYAWVENAFYYNYRSWLNTPP